MKNETEMAFSELPSVPRNDIQNEIAALDAEIPELSKESYANGYA
jgi:hypothetical protein